MAQLSIIAVGKTGAVVALAAAAAAGDKFKTSGREIFAIHNAHGTNPRTVTFDSLRLAPPDGSDNNVAVVIPATESRVIGPFPPQRFADGDGNVNITYSDAAADLTVAVLQAEEAFPKHR